MNLEFVGDLVRRLEIEIPQDSVVLAGVVAGLTLALFLLGARLMRRQLARRRFRARLTAEGRRRVHLYQADVRREPTLGPGSEDAGPRERRAAGGR